MRERGKEGSRGQVGGNNGAEKKGEMGKIKTNTVKCLSLVQQPESTQRSEMKRWRTNKVRSFGMWLKLETGILLMLLLFSVLAGERQKRDRKRQKTRRNCCSKKREIIYSLIRWLNNSKVEYSIFCLCWWGMFPFLWLIYQNTHSTSRDRSARNAPSSIQLIWFLSSWLVTNRKWD